MKEISDSEEEYNYLTLKVIKFLSYIDYKDANSDDEWDEENE